MSGYSFEQHHYKRFTAKMFDIIETITRKSLLFIST